MKKKILFYGNCQLGTISQYFLNDAELNEIFEIILCDESCAPMHIWRDDPSNFAVWTRENQPIQNEIFEGVHKKLRQADIFVFQATERNCIPELSTKYLCDNISTGKNICVPNTRLFVYCHDYLALRPYLDYAQTKVKNPKDAVELVDFITNSEDPGLLNILEQDYPISTNYKHYRNENSQRTEEEAKLYPHYIYVENFIRASYKTKLLAVQHNHMSRHYYAEVLRNLFDMLDLSGLIVKKQNICSPGEGHIEINATEFKFFQSYFPDLDFPRQEKFRNLTRIIQEMHLKEL
jgi:hypothetical protein